MLTMPGEQEVVWIGEPELCGTIVELAERFEAGVVERRIAPSRRRFGPPDRETPLGQGHVLIEGL
jgi:hypothetical protein